MSVGRLSPIAGLVQLRPQRCDRFLIATFARELLERSPDGLASGDLRRKLDRQAIHSRNNIGTNARGRLRGDRNAHGKPRRQQRANANATAIGLAGGHANAPRPGRGRVRTKSAAAFMSAPYLSVRSPVVQTRRRRALACQRAATTMISTLYCGPASLASTVARAGVLPGTT